jgi:hypothetical protein
MGSKRTRNKGKSWEELKSIYGVYRPKPISLHEAVGIMAFGCGCDQEEDEIQIEPWLMREIEEAGLLGELLYAAKVAGADGELKFLNINGLAGKGGYRDIRKK